MAIYHAVQDIVFGNCLLIIFELYLKSLKNQFTNCQINILSSCILYPLHSCIYIYIYTWICLSIIHHCFIVIPPAILLYMLYFSWLKQATTWQMVHSSLKYECISMPQWVNYCLYRLGKRYWCTLWRSILIWCYTLAPIMVHVVGVT